MRPKMYALIFLIMPISAATAFLLPSSHTTTAPMVSDGCSHRNKLPSGLYAGSNNEEESSDEDQKEKDGVSTLNALPAIGASSFNAGESSDPTHSNESNTKNNNNIIISEHTNLVSRKFKLQYTCKICDHRNSHSVSRIAYRNGVVIAFCKGCESKHLIADNLGWSNYIGGFDFDGGERNIEHFMENKARENAGVGGDDDDLVMRVNQEVFDLENMLYKGRGEKARTEKDDVEDESSWN